MYADSISFIGYVILAIVLKNNQPLRKDSKYLMSLAVSDCFVMIHCGMAVAACFFEEWPFGDAGCSVNLTSTKLK